MLPYQIYQALMDEHVHDLHAAAHRHERAAEIRRASAGRTARASHVTGALGRLLALAPVTGRAQGRRTASAGSAAGRSRTGRTTAPGSTAGPMGCVT